MNAPVLGLVTIGQTPRPDLERVFGTAAPHARIRVAGALDGWSRAAVESISGRDGCALLARLSDGTAIEVPQASLYPLVIDRAALLTRLGATAIVVVCAGGFPSVSAPVPVLLPGRIVPAVVGALARTRRIGIVLPNQAQMPFALARWREAGFEARPTWVSPVDEGVNFDRAAGEMQDPSLELVVLDCMGHDEAFRERFASRCGRPVLAAQTMVARIAAAMV